MLFFDLLTKPVDYLACSIDTDIAHDKGLFEFLVEFLVHI